MKFNNVKVVDDLMGSGKSSWAIEYMKRRKGKEKFMYVTPFLNEVERIKKEIPHFVEPKNKGFMPKSGHLIELIERGEDIAMSHELLKTLSVKQFNKLKDYTLILDETLNFISVYKGTSPKDMEEHILSKAVLLDNQTNQYTLTPLGKGLTKNKKNEKPHKDKETFKIIEEGRLSLYGGKTFICELPKEIVTSFKDLYILTYLFEGSVAYAFLKLHNIAYKKFQVVNGRETEYKLQEYSDDLYRTRAAEYFKPINIHEGKYNGEIKKKAGRLSYSAQKKKKEKEALELGKIIRNYFLSVGAHSSRTLWSTFNPLKDKVVVKGYKGKHLVYNSRATNEYRECDTLAYCIEKHSHPAIKNFLKGKYNVTLDENMLALDSMLQWIFRSRIRNKKSINLFLPSKKMRELLNKWGGIEKTIYKKAV